MGLTPRVTGHDELDKIEGDTTGHVQGEPASEIGPAYAPTVHDYEVLVVDEPRPKVEEDVD